jgi:hypothetical protein
LHTIGLRYSNRRFITEVETMASNKNSSSNRVEVPEARDAMDRFKMEVANELGVNLKQGYNGDITARDAGSIGGEMVRKMIKRQEEEMAGQSR